MIKRHHSWVLPHRFGSNTRIPPIGHISPKTTISLLCFLRIEFFMVENVPGRFIMLHIKQIRTSLLSFLRMFIWELGVSTSNPLRDQSLLRISSRRPIPWSQGLVVIPLSPWLCFLLISAVITQTILNTGRILPLETLSPRWFNFN